MDANRTSGAKIYLVVVSSLLGVVFLAILVVIVLLALKEPSEASDTERDYECEEGIREICQPGFTCIGYECVEDPPAACEEGQKKDSRCECLAPMEWQSEVCKTRPRPAEEEATPEQVARICQMPEIRDAVKELVTQCGGKGLTECPPGSFDKLVMSSYRFDKLMSVFPDRVSIHFPFGLPKLNSHSWPDSAVKSHYLAQLKDTRKLLDDAKLVFVIGRASASRDRKRSQAFATARINLVLRTLLPTLYGDSPDDKKQLASLDRKVMLFALGESKSLSPDFFSRNFSHRYTTWNPASRVRLQQILTNPGSMTAKEQEWAQNTINQMVLVVPIPCDGTEATTPPSP